MDNPSSASTPFKSRSKTHSSLSTNAISPEKRKTAQQGSPVKRNSESRAEQIRKMKEIEAEYSKSTAEKNKVQLQKKKVGTVKRGSEETDRNAEDSIRNEFEEFKIQQAEIVGRMEEEIVMLRKKLHESNNLARNNIVNSTNS